jgi:hypothetical protein
MIKEEAASDDTHDDVSNMENEDVIRDAPQKIIRERPPFTFDNYFADEKS